MQYQYLIKPSNIKKQRENLCVHVDKQTWYHGFNVDGQCDCWICMIWANQWKYEQTRDECDLHRFTVEARRPERRCTCTHSFIHVCMYSRGEALPHTLRKLPKHAFWRTTVHVKGQITEFREVIGVIFSVLCIGQCNPFGRREVYAIPRVCAWEWADTPERASLGGLHREWMASDAVLCDTKTTIILNLD